MRSDLRDVLRVIALSRITYKKMMQNSVWATAYNVIAIPAAAGAFVHWGITLPMSIGALAMNLSTVIVAVNAQFLRHFRHSEGCEFRSLGLFWGQQVRLRYCDCP